MLKKIFLCVQGLQSLNLTSSGTYDTVSNKVKGDPLKSLL